MLGEKAEGEATGLIELFDEDGGIVGGDGVDVCEEAGDIEHFILLIWRFGNEAIVGGDIGGAKEWRGMACAGETESHVRGIVDGVEGGDEGLLDLLGEELIVEVGKHLTCGEIFLGVCGDKGFDHSHDYSGGGAVARGVADHDGEATIFEWMKEIHVATGLIKGFVRGGELEWRNVGKFIWKQCALNGGDAADFGVYLTLSCSKHAGGDDMADGASDEIGLEEHIFEGVLGVEGGGMREFDGPVIDLAVLEKRDGDEGFIGSETLAKDIVEGVVEVGNNDGL